MELNCIIFTSLYRTFSTSHGIEFTVNDRKILYGLIPLSFTVCNRTNYVFLKSVGSLNLKLSFHYLLVHRSQIDNWQPVSNCMFTHINWNTYLQGSLFP